MNYFAPILLIFFVYFVGILVAYLFGKEFRKLKLKKEFFVLLSKVVKENKDYKNIHNEVELLFKISCKRNKFPEDSIRIFMDLLEEYIYIYQLKGEDKFNRTYKVSVTDEEFETVMGYLNYIREDYKFLRLPSKQASLLRDINKIVETSDSETGYILINQLSEEIEKFTSYLEQSERKVKWPYVFTLIGIVLTIVFGVLSLI